MKQCNNYEEAMHYDCAECDEDCEYRKEGDGGWKLIFLMIGGLILGSVVYNIICGLF